jgi:hypothetical protein
MLPGNHCIQQNYFITWSSIYSHFSYLIYIFVTNQPLSHIIRRVQLLWDTVTVMHITHLNTDKRTEESSRPTLKEGTGQIINIVVVVHVDGVRPCLWTVATSGLTVHPPGDIWVWRATVEWYWQGKWKNLEKNLSQCHFFHRKSHMDWPGCKPGPLQWEASD